MVSGLGWLSIVVFGGISALAGSVMAIIFDDFFTKYRMGFMTKPVNGAILWAIFSVAWLAIQASLGHDWWRQRDPGEDFNATDALWWSYISCTTVGLGDYFLAPETMFVVDVFSWSLIFLFGVV